MKRYALLFLLLISIFVPACSDFEIQECNKKTRQTSYVTVATAFSLETEAVLEQITEQQSCQYDGIVYHFGNVEEQQIMLFETGVGPEKAKKNTSLTLTNFQVEILVYSGISGGLTENAIGQTFVPNQWFDLETGEKVQIDEHLFSLSGFASVNGSTSPKFVDDKKTVEYLRSEFDAVIVDMETYHVAKIAADNKIPFIAFRSVSDHADGDKKKEFYQQAAQASAVQVVKFILLYCNTSP
ncbi:MAG: 5'-methylthioadenosine/S-adenosylhomocysteine nucleosidase [Candidatus Pacebacteria bacterium]|nr:5'-methylthioadenosine/S-adenosylhomocysteine nucleosidase [Candidatus Paceibacterota bacterium]